MHTHTEARTHARTHTVGSLEKDSVPDVQLHAHTHTRTHAHTYLRATEVTYVNVFPDDDVPGCGTFRSLSSARDPVAAAFKGVHLRPAAICTGTQTVLYHPAHKHITVPLCPWHTNTSLYPPAPGTQTHHCTTDFPENLHRVVYVIIYKLSLIHI